MNNRLVENLTDKKPCVKNKEMLCQKNSSKSRKSDKIYIQIIKIML